MIVEVTVKTGTSQEKIVETPGGVSGGGETPRADGASGGLTVYLRAKPHDGEANAALIKALAKHFDVAKSAVIIKKGAKSHCKLVEILI